MTKGKFVIHISGSGCSGKSSLADALAVKFPGAYLVSFDKLKWQLAGYNRNKPGCREFIEDVQLALFEIICRKSIPVFFDFYFRDEQKYAQAKKIVEDNGYSIIHVGLKAPKEVLLNRFR